MDIVNRQQMRKIILVPNKTQICSRVMPTSLASAALLNRPPIIDVISVF